MLRKGTKSLTSTLIHTNKTQAQVGKSPRLYRNKRQALVNDNNINNDCDVKPDVPVILNGKETYFKFDSNESVPALYPGENGNMTCPAPFGSWWPGTENRMRASCPWTWMTFDTWNFGHEIYPRFVKQARCLCVTCVNARSMGCKNLRRPFTFYRKIGCQGNKPVFEEGRIEIIVGCYCAKLH